MTPGEELKYPSRKLVIHGDDLLGIPFFPASNYECFLQTLMSRHADGSELIFKPVLESIDFKVDKHGGTATRQTSPAGMRSAGLCGKLAVIFEVHRGLDARLWQPMRSRTTGCFVAAPFACGRKRQYFPTQQYFYGYRLDIYLFDAIGNDI